MPDGFDEFTFDNIISIFRLIFQTLMSIVFFKDCSAYDGIPNSSGSVCCGKNCGTCGGSGCRNRPGGATKCCSGEITKTCGLNQKAPCRPPISEFAKKVY